MTCTVRSRALNRYNILCFCPTLTDSARESPVNLYWRSSRTKNRSSTWCWTSTTLIEKKYYSVIRV